MAICSICGKDNPENVNNCAECGADLLDDTPTRESSDKGGSEDLVQLATFHTVSEADMVQELLESNGITSVLHGEKDPIGAMSGAEPITLLVEKQSLASALDLYEAFFAGDATVQEDASPADSD